MIWFAGTNKTKTSNKNIGEDYYTLLCVAFKKVAVIRQLKQIIVKLNLCLTLIDCVKLHDRKM